MEIEFRHLLYFVAVVEEQSFHRGAVRLGISQPTLTRQLGELERGLGLKLLARSRTGVTATEAGIQFLRHAREMLAERALMLSVLRSYGGGRLRIGYIAPSLFGAVGEAIAETRRRFPDVAMEMVEAAPGVQLEMLLKGKIEVAFVGHCEQVVAEELELVPLYQIPLAAVVPQGHRLATRGSVPLSELASEVFVSLQEELFPGRQGIIAKACRAGGFEVTFVHLADSLISLLTLIGHGQGISLVPLDASSIAHPHVVFVPIEGMPPDICFHAVIRRGSACPALEGLLELGREIGRDR